jgi:integrase
MASLQKIAFIRWVGADGMRVKPDTLGAKKVKEKSAKWYACWKEGKKQIRVPLCTDKAAAQAMLTDLMRTKDRIASKLIDPYQPHLDRQVAEHMEEYLASIVSSGKVKDGPYFVQKRRILGVIFRNAEIKTPRDITAEAIDGYLTAMRCASATKRIHLTAINAFIDWLISMKRMATNPLVGIARPRGGKIIRKRRALNPDELQRLLTAARERPLADSLRNTGGRNNAGKVKKEFVSKLRAETVATLTLLGRERALLYKTAIYTGLRKNELSKLQVKYLDLDRKPYPSFELPGEFTKNGEEARQLLVPLLAEELHAWIADTGKKPDDPLFEVPLKMVPIMKRDLKRARITYKDEKGRYADFHALRKSAGTMLGVAGVPIRIRLLFMRHGDIRLTMQTYDDSDFSSLEEAVRAMEALGLK